LEELADTVGDENITLIPQDLNDGKALEPLGPLLFDKFGRVNNFVANAGLLGTLSPLHQADPTQWNQVFQVNVTANLHLIRTLHPLLTKSVDAHAIFVTSSVAKNPRAFWGAYAASKAALENMVEGYAQEAEGKVNVSIFDPGGTATRMRASAFPGEDPKTLPPASETAARLVKLFD
jgi:NAD(P)-dependent dehydrogenase (short-subunit alcohol dehydrogenase family)